MINPVSPAMADQIVNEQSADSVFATQSIINRQVERLDQLKKERKTHRESLTNLFENDTNLSLAQAQVKEVNKDVKRYKAVVSVKPEAQQIKNKIAESTEQIKELEESLNSHLVSYFSLTGTKVFDTPNGEQREFVVKAKVKPVQQRLPHT